MTERTVMAAEGGWNSELLGVSCHPAKTGAIEHESSRGNLHCQKLLPSKGYMKTWQTENTQRVL
jgi:hypothetical protein